MIDLPKGADVTREEEDALRDLAAASKFLGSYSAKAERPYGIAYKRCVQLGLKPRLKRKYNNV